MVYELGKCPLTYEVIERKKIIFGCTGYQVIDFDHEKQNLKRRCLQ